MNWLASCFGKFESIVAASVGVIPTIISWMWPADTPVSLSIYVSSLYVCLAIIWFLLVLYRNNSLNEKISISHIDWLKGKMMLEAEGKWKFEQGQCLTVSIIDNEGYNNVIGLARITHINKKKLQVNVLFAVTENEVARLKNKKFRDFSISTLVNYDVIEIITRMNGGGVNG